MKNIFVCGLDAFNLAQLKAIDQAGHYRYLPLFRYEEVKAGPLIPAEHLLKEGWQKLASFHQPIDAVVGYWDFPVSTMLPLLRKPFDLPSPSFEAVLRCEHKYWSRLEQAQVVADHTPAFCVFDPFADSPQIDLAYPIWVKPVKSASSILGFRIDSDAQLEVALEQIRAGIARFAEPFDYLLQYARLPPEVAGIRGWHCIAEAIISTGQQVTLEGYVYAGEVHVYGVVDSLREGRYQSSFSRYQYPSNIPDEVQTRMIKITEQFLRHIQFDDSPFNIEFYWDTDRDHIMLLEVNTRISKSHAPLFKKVDGAYHHQVMVQCALGERPRFPYRQGAYPFAAKFMWRRSDNALVQHVPDAAGIQAVEEQISGVEIQLHIHEGMRLSDLRDQDSYSYEMATIFVGGNSPEDMEQKYRHCQQLLDLQLETIKTPN